MHVRASVRPKQTSGRRGVSLICVKRQDEWHTHTFVTQAWDTLLLTQLDCVGLDECIISEIKSREAVLETLSLWITARMRRATEPLHVLCPLLLIFIFADSLFPKPLYRPFSWTYLCSMPEEGPSPSITGSSEVSQRYVAPFWRPVQWNDEGKVEHVRPRQSITWLVWLTNSAHYWTL